MITRIGVVAFEDLAKSSFTNYKVSEDILSGEIWFDWLRMGHGIEYEAESVK